MAVSHGWSMECDVGSLYFKGVKLAKPSNASTKEKPSSVVNMSITYADPDKFVEEILEKTRTKILSEVSYSRLWNLLVQGLFCEI